ncbi:unnamed protein product [Timema podura]|uniref:SWAP70 N-terminal EF-hand domain-containing protein n=1 Tax=Timema podura TaxID=61482 RepID=A0ABN7NV12_TIMPD|nr:unnamed protein product [Timema podura]
MGSPNPPLKLLAGYGLVTGYGSEGPGFKAKRFHNVSMKHWAWNRVKFSLVRTNEEVLTANIGTLLDLYGVEKGLEHYRSTNELNFEHYKYYLQKEVFSSLPDTISLPTLREYESRIDEVCWLVCKKHYLHREHVVFSDLCVYKLFRIFCLLADLVPESSQVFQVCIRVTGDGLLGYSSP